MPPIKHDIQRPARRSLDDILNGPDEFGMLEVQVKRSNSGTPPELAKFEAINAFIDQYGHKPSGTGEMSEKLLARSLVAYLKNQNLHAALRPYDRHGLLEALSDSNSDPAIKSLESHSDDQAKGGGQSVSCDAIKKTESVTSLDDIFSSDEFASFDLGESDLFEATHVKFSSFRESPEEVARRKASEDFYKFEGIFKEIHDGLQSQVIKTIRYSQASQIREGDAFILKGVICFIDHIGEYRTNTDGRYDPRLRVIFENGTESNLLLRSLSKRLYEDETGRRIIRDADSVVEAFNNVTHKDKRAGQIYFVTTRSDNVNLKAIPNLIKIGYTELTVEERTKNAERDTAFLEAPIKILASMECYNMNPNKFETLIHGFLHAQRLKMTLVGKDGKTYHPKEWFSVSLDTARDVVKRIIDGSIVDYRMDNTMGRLVKKNN